jgi:hypothetical protein
MKARGMRWLWWVVVIGFVATSVAWAAYVVNFYFFLARVFPTHGREDRSLFLATAQAYLLAFGPLSLMLVVVAASILWARRPAMLRVR